MMASCEKFPLDSSSYEKDANILVNTSGISHEQATRSIKPLSELCTKISYVFYQDGERAKVVNQYAEDNGYGSMAVKLLLLPVIIGVGYELIKLAGRKDNRLTRIISAPGMWVQRISTQEPDDSMIEVAIAALQAVIPEQEGDDRW